MPHATTRLARLARSWLLFLAASLGAGALAAPYPNVYGAPREVMRQADWYRQCLRARQARPPLIPIKPTVGDVAARGAPQRCDASSLYYDTRNNPEATEADWADVRGCALRSGDNGVLMMLYANGLGVEPDLNLATRHACAIQSPVSEMKSRVDRLRRKMRGQDGEAVDVCDDAATGSARGRCGALRQRGSAQRHADRLNQLTSGWTRKEQIGFEMASKAAHHFAQHRADYETDRSAGERSLQLDTLGEELDRFARDLHDFESGKLPRFSEAEFVALEQKLNQVYARFMQEQPGPASYLGTIRKPDVERTQRAWLAYRDAMELFGSIRYPQVPASGWRALLTARRVRQLAELDNAAAGR